MGVFLKKTFSDRSLVTKQLIFLAVVSDNCGADDVSTWSTNHLLGSLPGGTGNCNLCVCAQKVSHGDLSYTEFVF